MANAAPLTALAKAARADAPAEGSAGHAAESDSALHRGADGAGNLHAPACVPDQHRLVATGRKVVPEWVRSLVPVVEPRLDAATSSATAWYLIADPAQIDTVEYCYLEGQQGVYIETKQGFEVDGVEIKARMDFGAAAIDYRGMQKNAGA